MKIKSLKSCSNSIMGLKILSLFKPNDSKYLIKLNIECSKEELEIIPKKLLELITVENNDRIKKLRSEIKNKK